jgi:hypothetical protein
LGYCIAAATAEPNRLVVAVEGDSGFGFSAMEVEVCPLLGLSECQITVLELLLLCCQNSLLVNHVSHNKKGNGEDW